MDNTFSTENVDSHRDKINSQNAEEVDAQAQVNVEDNVEGSSKKRRLTYDVWKDFERIKYNDGSQSAQYQNYKFHPTKEEWKVAQVICNCLEHFYKATNRFSGTSYPTSNGFFSDVCNIKLQMMKWETSEYDFLQKMATPMKLKFEKYWDECCLVLSVAVVLDPRYKMNLVEYYYNKIHSSLAASYIENVRCVVFELFNEYDDCLSCSKGESTQVAHGFSNDISSNDNELSGFVLENVNLKQHSIYHNITTLLISEWLTRYYYK
ncbi:hypothetical protein LXL04_014462 [Taraxacum kok-saghyz]